MAFGLTQNACKKAETTTSNTNNYPDLTGCKVTRFYDVTNETKISYNANGTIAKVEEYEAGSLYNTNTYTYETGKVSYVNTSGREKGEYLLDSKGRATSSAIIYYQAQDPTTATSGVMATYKYNADGNLIEKQEEYNSQSGKTSYLTTYQWTNGNLTSEIEVSSNNNTYITNYEYYMDKSNALGATDAAMDFTGVQSKNLVKAHKDGKNGSTIVSFTYDFNSSGKPTKVIFDEDGTKGEINLEMICP
ncbi:MAG: hypothetical protein ACOVP1_00600 [Bacteroidia bacterium]